MAIRNHPFIQLQANQIARPMLLVRYINPHTNQDLRTWALIDTGADDCSIPAGFAPILGHNLTAGTQEQIATGNGTTVGYKHTMKIEIPNFCTQDSLITFLPNLHIPLLGVRTFLSNFTLEVDYKNQNFSLKI